MGFTLLFAVLIYLLATTSWSHQNDGDIGLIDMQAAGAIFKRREEEQQHSIGYRHRYRNNNLRGIYIDFIYNPNYYFELSVLKFMLQEILRYNPNLNYEYDYENRPDSTIVTVSFEHSIAHYRQRNAVFVKPKLLKDILYTPNIFEQIYALLLMYFRSDFGDTTRFPEYDRSINFARYRDIFTETLHRIDADNANRVVCRNDELFDKYSGRLCIVPDTRHIKRMRFADPESRVYWQTLLPRIANLMTRLIVDALEGVSNSSSSDCYRIRLRPEADIRKVLLFPHKAVRTVRLDDRVSRENIRGDLILFKHRVLHALGLPHRYIQHSSMSSYNNPWQNKNLFWLLPEDLRLLSSCYRLRAGTLERAVERTNAQEADSMFAAMFADNRGFDTRKDTVEV